MRFLEGDYRDGLEAFSVFLQLLEEGLVTALPNVGTTTEAAFGWRGFSLRDIEGIEGGVYECQVYLKDPTILLFQERVQGKNKAIKYPFRVDLDLNGCGFFFEDRQRQLDILVSFLEGAVEEARRWHLSELRSSIRIRRKGSK